MFHTDDQIAYIHAVSAGLDIGSVAVKTGEHFGLVRLSPVWLTTHSEIHGNPRICAVFDFLSANFLKF
jgi:hypothetical protein